MAGRTTWRSPSVEPVDLTLAVLLVAGIGVLVGAAVQGAVGMGLGLIGAPVLPLLDPTLVPGPSCWSPACCRC